MPTMTKSKRRIIERDLRSDNNNRWAAAVVYASDHGCHNPYCGADGYCHAGGTCFSPLSSGSMEKSELVKAIHDLYDSLRDQLHEIDRLRAELKKLEGQAVSRNEILGIERQLEEMRKETDDGSAKEE